MAIGRIARLLGAAVLIVAALWYLRDPAWLSSYSSGLHPWEQAEDGRRVRWTKGHASFFVPSDARRVTLPLRSLKDNPADWPITVTVTIDDRLAERLTLHDETWRELSLRLPPPGGRRWRRIDLKLDRVRSRLRGVQLGEIGLDRQARPLPISMMWRAPGWTFSTSCITARGTIGCSGSGPRMHFAASAAPPTR